MKKTTLITAVMATMLLASCSSEMPTAEQPQANTERHPIELTASIETPASRATTDLQSTTVDKSVTLGVFVSKVGGEEPIASNVKYTFDSNSSPQSWKVAEGQSPVYFPTDGSPINITIYAPYKDGISDVSNIPTASSFVVKNNQTSDADYLDSDLIKGSKKDVRYTGTPVDITMQHLLSKVTVTLVPGNSLTIEELKGATMTIGSVSTTLPSDLAADASSASQAVILSPSTIASGNEFISITLSSGTYFPYVLPSDLTLEAGKQYTYSFTLKATGISLNTDSVTDWTTGGTFTDGEMKTE